MLSSKFEYGIAEELLRNQIAGAHIGTQVICRCLTSLSSELAHSHIGNSKSCCITNDPVVVARLFAFGIRLRLMVGKREEGRGKGQRLALTIEDLLDSFYFLS